jgi:hypothetical protein
MSHKSTAAEAVRLRAEGLSLRAIGEQLGVDQKQVQRWLKALDAPKPARVLGLDDRTYRQTSAVDDGITVVPPTADTSAGEGYEERDEPEAMTDEDFDWQQVHIMERILQEEREAPGESQEQRQERRDFGLAWLMVESGWSTGRLARKLLMPRKRVNELLRYGQFRIFLAEQARVRSDAPADGDRGQEGCPQS